MNTKAQRIAGTASGRIAGVWVMDWIKCSERMPEFDKSVLLKGPGTIIFIGQRKAARESTHWPVIPRPEHWAAHGAYVKDLSAVTHWMPLPEPPKGEA